MKKTLWTILISLFIPSLSWYVLGNEKTNTEPLQLDTLQVTSKKRLKKTVNVKELEASLGIQEDLNKIIAKNPGIRQIPEAGSQILVNGGSIYDNQFMLNGIPMFIPAHFSGHMLFDINSLLVPACPSIDLITLDISGKYAGFSHAVITVEPDIFTKTEGLLTKRPEMLLTLSNYDVGLCVSKRFRQGKDHFQVTANFPNRYLMEFRKENNPSFNKLSPWCYSSFQEPLWYQDITLTGKSNIKNVILQEHFWLASDAYSAPTNGDNQEIINWGSGSINIKDAGLDNKWQITTGGSRQYLLQRKMYSTIILQQRLYRTNGVLSGELNERTIGPFMVDFALQNEYVSWHAKTEKYQKDSSVLVTRISSNEIYAAIRTSIKRQRSKFSYGLDILGGGLINSDYSLFYDPGIWSKYLINNGFFSFTFGIHTSWPDIRGLPSEQYRLKQIKTYLGAFSLEKSFFNKLYMIFQGYARYKDHCPALADNPAELRWDETNATPLIAGGISGEINCPFNQFIATNLLFDISRAKRKRNNRYTTYEWDIPWSLQPGIRLTLFSNTVKLFLSGMVTEGIPYRNLIKINNQLSFSQKLERMPIYKRVDFKMQFDRSIKDHRYFTGFHVFLDAKNIFDVLNRFRFGAISDPYWKNVREYYWNEHMVKRAVSLERSSISMGVRASFKL